MSNQTTSRSPRGFSIWPGMIFVLIGINVCVVATTVYFAHADRSFAVERDYYQKAVAWNQNAQQIQRNHELGWHPALTIEPGAVATHRVLVVRVTDADGQPIEQALVSLSAFPSVRASQRQELILLEHASGEYRAMLSSAMNGLWEFRFVIRRGDEVFTSSIQQMIDPAREAR